MDDLPQSNIVYDNIEAIYADIMDQYKYKAWKLYEKYIKNDHENDRWETLNLSYETFKYYSDELEMRYFDRWMQKDLHETELKYMFDVPMKVCYKLMMHSFERFNFETV